MNLSLSNADDAGAELPAIQKTTLGPLHQWVSVAIGLALGAGLLGVVFRDEIVAAVQVWSVSTAYTHCFLIIPLAAYLLWRRGGTLRGMIPRPTPAPILLGIPLAAAWLCSERLGIIEGRQLVAIGFVQVLFMAELGPGLWRAAAGPLLYLYFLVPFGDVLVPALQTITTEFIRHGLVLLHVPAYIDGYNIDIPEGTFVVAEACAGLRFMIASLAFGCFYALLIYRSLLRRCVFVLVSLAIPVVANGLRALAIVYLGHVQGGSLAAAADHIVYGWVFFSIVIALLIAAGLPFRQDGTTARLASASPALRPRAVGPMMTATIGTVLLAAAGPAVSAALLPAGGPGAAQTPVTLDLGPDCVVQKAEPADAALPSIRSERAVCDGQAMDLRWETLPSRSTAADLLSERHRLVSRVLGEDLQQAWAEPGGDTPSAWRIMTSSRSGNAMAVSLWVDGKPVRPDLAMRVRMGIDSLRGSAAAPMIVIVSPAVAWGSLGAPERAAALAGLAGFVRAHGDLGVPRHAMSVRNSAEIQGPR